MKDKVPVENFFPIVKVTNGKAETIADAIDKELTVLDIACMYDNIIVIGF